ncbi:MAG: hypothetical protein ACP6IY_22565 [Promethearchaeia archaeon]
MSKNNGTLLKGLFVDKDVKKIVELNMSLLGFTSRNQALVNMLNESPRYNELVQTLKQISTPQNSHPIDSGENIPSTKPQEDDFVSPLFHSSSDEGLVDKKGDIIDLTKKSVGELLKE